MKRITLVLFAVVLIMLCSVAYAGLFPSSDEAFGTTMPSISFAIDREADGETVTDEGTTLIYENFTDVDYSAFNLYLLDKYTVANYEVNGAEATIIIQDGDASITFVYNRANQTASMTYPNGTRIEKEKHTNNNGSALPSLSVLFGEEVLPSLSKALDRAPDRTTSESGEIIEEYYNFSFEDYQTFSTYLLEYGCYVENSVVNDNVLTVTLKKGSTPFTFIYDYAANKAIIRYAGDTKCEPGVTPTPEPTSVPVKATVKPNKTMNECFNIAKNYIKTTLKNPSSLQVHSYEYSLNGTEYTFYIDYSAQNGFGGYNRETYIVKVDSKTGSISLAYST